MAKIEPHKSKDNPEMTKIANQAAAEVAAGKQPQTHKVPIKNPQASTPVHKKSSQ